MQAFKIIPTNDVDEVSRAFELMPVLLEIRDRFAETKPLDGARVAVVFHLTKEAACLALTVQAAGAEVRFVPSKLATVETEVVRKLTSHDIHVARAETEKQRSERLSEILTFAPQMVVDNADLFSLWHEEVDPPPLLCASVHSRSACALVEDYWDRHHKVLFPVIAVGSSEIKLELESTHGTGQSVVTALIQATGLQLAGKNVVVVGYGNVGRGVAHFIRGLNARVCVVQRSAFRALKAAMDGYEVLRLSEAIPRADVVITATGARGVITEEHFPLFRDGVFVGNVGRVQEIDVPALCRLGKPIRRINDNLTEYRVNGNRIVLMGDGHQFNHMARCANSSEVMDLSLSLHALSLEYVWSERPGLSNSVHPVPSVVSETVAQSKLKHLGINLT
ncbi:MAG TPA: adenosylhomocysteinase [Pyrinomonadaceae bacterium]|nr:adenosylhomocysteinase [Pyrinomonadaceae bacterium]